ncbi:hypothetical protein BD779DRAFT_1592630 [Infundibulicybe gibba]|nr:hypothetical protein BD779DRAFT_1592630 [Infundibulicybe gibba]
MFIGLMPPLALALTAMPMLRSTPPQASSRSRLASKPAPVCSYHGHVCRIPGPNHNSPCRLTAGAVARPSLVQHLYEYCHVHQLKVYPRSLHYAVE